MKKFGKRSLKKSLRGMKTALKKLKESDAKLKNGGKTCYLLKKVKSYNHRAEKDRIERCSGNC